MRILFLFAHPDDESFGPAGTITSLVNDGHDVTVVSLCKGDRPGNEEVSNNRTEAFHESCSLMGAAGIVLDHSDCTLEFRPTLASIECVIKTIDPDIVYTHNISDVHQDHRLVAEACMIACRPKTGSTITALYMCEIPGATDWTFGQIEPQFIPNTYVDVTSNMNIKEQVLKNYSTETYEFPDARSVESMEVLAKYRGKQIGIEAAEAFKQVFRLC